MAQESHARWDFSNMVAIANKLFSQVYKKKKLAHDHHDIHFLVREITKWLPESIELLREGRYSPRHLRRWQFSDETVDSLGIPDRILQHVLLQELKSTFKHVMNPNCYHLNGPHGVKLATDRVMMALTADEKERPVYVIRADIKSYYASIPHYKLVQDMKKAYDDPKVQKMLEEVIRNGIETNKGYRNPDRGIALRGPLSQLFSGLYLKPLDDAFDNMTVTYVRFQDDVLVFCKTKRQLNRCWRKMMDVLHERKLMLSRKKTRVGRIDEGFHFLGIDYLGTRTWEEYTGEVVDSATEAKGDIFISDIEGGG